MKIVLDTNCFISSIGKNSPYRKVFDAFLDEKYDLCISTEILLEYEEKFLEFWGREVCDNLLGVLLTAENISLHSIFFNFYLVEGDVDDNKFVDAYLSSSADFLVTNDSKLLAVKNNDFPEVKVLTLIEFLPLLD